MKHFRFGKKVSKPYLLLIGSLFGTTLLQSCQTDAAISPDKPVMLNVPLGFPDMEIPSDNQLTEQRIALGKMLFFDPALSVDSTISCGSCHFQHIAFTDGKAFSVGVNNATGLRNAPSLGNIGYHPVFFRDGGVPTLEQQVLAPIVDENEMNFTIPGIIQRMNNNPMYVMLSRIAYNRAPDPFVLTRAIAAFERTLITGNARFDQYVFQGKSTMLNESEIRGMTLFMSERTQCATCHAGFDFTDYSFRNNGLYEVYADSGRNRITGLNMDYGKFKVASLRNVALTAPYMHDGSLATLQDVIDHYNRGGNANFNKDSLIKSLNLTSGEKQDIINFLESLTDLNFITNPAFSP